MASAIAKPQKRLWEFLNEQQEPFILEVYLSEREYSKRWSLNGDSSKSLEKSASSGLNKKRKALLPFPKVLTALHNKLDFYTESNILTRDYDQRHKHVSDPEAGLVDHIVQFSTASSSTVFNSCLDIDEEGASISSHKDHPLFPSGTCQTSSVCNMGLHRQRQRCIEGSLVSLGKIPLPRVPYVNETVGGMEQRIQSCSVLLPKKITEDSLFSTAIWSFQSAKTENCTLELRELPLGPNDVSQILKSKRVFHKIKKLLFDCMTDITITLPTKDDRKQGYKQFMRPQELGKLICERTKEWNQQAGDGANLTYLLTLDYQNSITEWNNSEPHVNDICCEITDAILERINNEIVSEMTETLGPTV